jgi:hypothetical protein
LKKRFEKPILYLHAKQNILAPYILASLLSDICVLRFTFLSPPGMASVSQKKPKPQALANLYICAGCAKKEKKEGNEKRRCTQKQKMGKCFKNKFADLFSDVFSGCLSVKGKADDFVLGFSCRSIKRKESEIYEQDKERNLLMDLSKALRVSA